MSGLEIAILSGLILVIAVLYSSVGHAGASGYLAAMALAGMAPEEMKPTALVLNIFVAAIGTYRFARAGHFHFGTFWPFAATAIPMAFLGGWWHLPATIYQPLIGLVLIFAAVMLLYRAWAARGDARRSELRGMPSLGIALPVGAALGLLAGLTGTGGGIFLSPLLILFGWADPKRTAAVSVVFVLVNSASGLLGHVAGIAHVPAEIPYFLAAAVVGGFIGSGLGASRRTGADVIRLLLAAVLLIAATKMLLPTLRGVFTPGEGHAITPRQPPGAAVSFREDAGFRQPTPQTHLHSGVDEGTDYA